MKTLAVDVSDWRKGGLDGKPWFEAFVKWVETDPQYKDRGDAFLAGWCAALAHTGPEKVTTEDQLRHTQEVIRIALKDTVLGAGSMRAMLEDCLCTK